MKHQKEWHTCDRCGAEIKKEYCAEIRLQRMEFLISHTTCAVNAWKILGDLLKMKRMIDFIKSWLYYPKMVKYLKDKCGIEYKNSRLGYSWWHCHTGKLK